MLINHSSLLGKKDIIRRLNEKEKTKRLIVSPILSSSQIQPASLDVRLGPDFLIIKIGKITHLDPLRSPESVKFEVEKYTDKYKILNKYERFILHPNEFILGCTLEYVRLPNEIAARVEGRSSWGRLGLMVHSTAGFIDPGFCGNITFELKNMGKVPVPLYPGIRMAQLSFFEVENDESYEGKYNESFGVVPSKYFDDYEFREIRKSYGKESFEDVVDEIFNSVEDKGPCPRTKYPDRFPQELIEAIASSFERYRDATSYNDHD
jgi:dCTP deaminase